MIPISKNLYINKLNDIVDKQNNACHRSINMKPAGVTSSTSTNTAFAVENNNKDLNFKVGVHVRISKYENIFQKIYSPKWPDEVFAIRKVRNTVPWTYVNVGLRGEAIIRKFHEKELRKRNQRVQN